MTALLELENIEAGYGARRVLTELSLSVMAGEVVGLVGPNGAGKSTLLRIAAGIVRPFGGTVRLDTARIDTLARRDVARKLAILPQTASTEFSFSARELIEMGRLPHLGAFESLGDRDRSALSNAIHEAGVEELLSRRFQDLSEGEKQRVLLARCLAQEPRVLLLDEPTASLDVRHAWALMRVVRTRAQAGTAVVAAIHDLALAARVCDRVIVLAKGRIRSEGPPERALCPEVIAEVFGMRARVVREPEGVLITIVGANDPS
jgi:iron complex transport system ATP-binding protein